MGQNILKYAHIVLENQMFSILKQILFFKITCSSAAFHFQPENTTARAAVPWPLSKICLSFSGSIHELCYLSPNFQHDLQEHRLTRAIALISAGRPCLSGSADTM